MQLATSVHRATQDDVRVLKQLCHFHLELHTARAKLDQVNNQRDESARVQPARALAPLQVLQQWVVQDPWMPCPNQLHLLHTFSWGHGYAVRLLEWMKQCTWPAQASSVPDDPGISWHELYVSWVLTSRMLVPVRRPAASPERLQPLHSLQDTDVHQVTFGEQVSEFLILITPLAKLIGYDVWPTDRRGSARSLYRLGSALHHRAFHSRPVIPRQEDVVQIMSTYVRSRQQYDVMPPLEVDAIPDDLCAAMAGNWEQRRRRAGNAIATIKSRRARGPQIDQYFQRTHDDG